MARQKKPSGRLSSGPWDYAHIRACFVANQWYETGDDGSHVHFQHPWRPGKVTIDKTWTGVKTGHDAFRAYWQRQTDYTRKEMKLILNGRVIDRADDPRASSP